METYMQLFINGVSTGSAYALMAVSFTLIYGTVRFFHFAHGAAYTSAAYLAFSSAALSSGNPIVTVASGVIGAGLLGALMELCLYRPLRARFATPVILLLASIGLLIICQNCISLLWGDATRTLSGSHVREGLQVLGARITVVQLATVVAALVLYLLVVLYLFRTKGGTMLRAVSSDPDLARVVGIRRDRVILLAFMGGSSLAGVAAILASYDTGLRPTMGFLPFLMGVVAVVVGGVGSVSGALLGAFTIAFAQQLSVLVLPSKWQDAIVFILLLLVLLFRPHGLLGRPLRKAQV